MLRRRRCRLADMSTTERGHERRAVEGKRYDLASILARGQQALGVLIDDMAEVEFCDQDEKYFAGNLAKCVEAVARLQAEERAKLEWERKCEIAGDVGAAVLEFLHGLPAAELDHLMAVARAARAPDAR
jgi:hypothetical protein